MTHEEIFKAHAMKTKQVAYDDAREALVINNKYMAHENARAARAMKKNSQARISPYMAHSSDIVAKTHIRQEWRYKSRQTQAPFSASKACADQCEAHTLSVDAKPYVQHKVSSMWRPRLILTYLLNGPTPII